MKAKFLITALSALAGAAFALDTWYGVNGDYVIDTGLDDGGGTSGYWYYYDDSDDGGNTELYWPTDFGNEYSDEAFDPIIGECGGVCFVAELGSAYDYAYAGIAFNVTGSDMTGGDASAWEGIDICYVSDAKLILELGPENEASVTAYDNFIGTLASSKGSVSLKSIAWSDFSQEGWGTTADIEDIVADLASVKFKVSRTAGLKVGTQYFVNITAVGEYGSISSCPSGSLTETFISSDSEEETETSSSSSGTSTSSSSGSGSSSSSAALASSDWLWDGTAYDYRVETGLDDGTDTYGYWYSFDDSGDWGTSTITWPVELGNDYSEDAIDPVIDECGGLCFTATLGSGYDYPYAGVAFNVTGSDQTGGDASSWNGLAIVYSATEDLILELSPENEASVTQYNNFTVTLPSTDGATSTVAYSWSDFEQESGWGAETTIDAVTADLAAVKFKVSGLSTGTAYEYVLYKIATLEETSDSETSSSSSGSGSSSSSAAVASSDWLWDGTAYEYSVNTGLDDGTGTSGYWYSYDDSGDGGNSTITWPVELGNDYSEDAIDPVIDECAGLCFTATLNEGYDYPYVGVGFNVTGGDQVGGDASSWNGLTIVYSATEEMILELAPEDEASVTEYNNFTVTMPSTDGATSTVSYSWSEFEQASGWGVKTTIDAVTADLAAVKFKVSGLTTGTAYDYVLYKIGTVEETSDTETSSSSSGSGSSSSSTEGSSDSSPIVAAKVYAASKIVGTSLGLKVYTNSAAKVSVYDLRGSLVKSQKVGSGETQIGSLKAGAYMVKLSDGTKGMVRVQQ